MRGLQVTNDDNDKVKADDWVFTAPRTLRALPAVVLVAAVAMATVGCDSTQQQQTCQEKLSLPHEPLCSDVCKAV